MHFNPFSFEFVTNARKRERERASERETKRCMEERRNTIISPEGQGRVLYKFILEERKKNGGINFRFVQKCSERGKYNHQSLRKK